MIKDVAPLLKECEETLKELKRMGNMEVACYVQGFINSINKLPDEDQRPQWIPLTYRPMNEEEYEDFKREFGEFPIEEPKMFSCQMPEDDQEILVCTDIGHIYLDRCEMDECGYGLEENGDWDGIVAWMPLPEPYK